MNNTFDSVLEEHRNRYPDMEPQDYGKLAFQSEFGPEHLVDDKQSVLSFLKQELRDLPQDGTPGFSESIGSGLCRFPLSFCTSNYAVKLLVDLFVLTAQKHHGTMDGMMDKLEVLRKFEIPGLEAWLENWKEKGYPSVHHSETYRKAYQPHYRLIKREYAGFFSALLAIYELMGKKVPVLVGIDGRCGSGKTQFASLLRNLLPCSVIHMDDFYLPPSRRLENWTQIPGGNMDFARLRSEVLGPVKEREMTYYRPYDCEKGEFADSIHMFPRQLIIVEGSYAHHPSLMIQYDLKIFMTCSAEEKERRLKEREGSYFSMFQKQWIPMEENYFKSCAIEAGSDLQIDTSDFFL